LPLEDALELCTGSDTSESDSSDDDLEYSGMINALELANRVREQDFLIDMLKAQLACAERRADDVEVALSRAAERCTAAVVEAFAPVQCGNVRGWDAVRTVNGRNRRSVT
jgi:hypothetical protein